MNSSEHFLKQKIASFLGPSDFNVTYVGTALLTNTLKLMLNSLNTQNSFNLEENYNLLQFHHEASFRILVVMNHQFLLVSSNICIP